MGCYLQWHVFFDNHDDLLGWPAATAFLMAYLLDDTDRTDAHVLSIAEFGNDNTGRFHGADNMGHGNVICIGAGASGDGEEQDSDEDDGCRGVSRGGDNSDNVVRGSNENVVDGTIARACNVYKLGGNDGGRFFGTDGRGTTKT